MFEWNERQTKILELSSIHVLKSLAKIISEYDYHIEGQSQILTNRKFASIRILTDRRIIYETTDLTLEIFQLDTKKSYHVFANHKWFSRNISITQKGKVLSMGTNGNLRVWDPKSNECKIHLINFPYYCHAPVLEIQDEQVCCGSHDGMEIININTGITRHVLNGIEEPYKLLKLSNERIISLSNAATLRIYDINSWNSIFKLHVSGQHIKVIPDGRIICGLYNGEIWVLRPTSNLDPGSIYVHDLTLKGHYSSITALITLSNNRVASAADDNLIKIWDIDNGSNILTLKGHTRYISCIAELPDGRIISGSNDTTLKIWNLLPTAEYPLIERCEKTLHDSGGIIAIQLFPDGRIVSASVDTNGLGSGSLRIWW